jgi:Lsr2
MTVSDHIRQRHTGAPSRTDTAQIRKWAKERGIEVSERGRLALAVIEQYDDWKRENPDG